MFFCCCCRSASLLIIRLRSIIATAKSVSVDFCCHHVKLENRKVCIYVMNSNLNILGTIYEGTSNIQLNTIAKLIDAEYK